MRAYKRDKNWCEIDTFGGAKTKVGQKVRITPKVGVARTVRIIRIEKSSDTVQDHSTTCNIPIENAIVRYRGLEVRLVDLDKQGFKLVEVR